MGRTAIVNNHRIRCRNAIEKRFTSPGSYDMILLETEV